MGCDPRGVSVGYNAAAWDHQQGPGSGWVLPLTCRPGSDGGPQGVSCPVLRSLERHACPSTDPPALSVYIV